MRNLFTNKLHYYKLFVMALISTICIIFCQASLFAQTGPNDDFDGDGIVNNLDADDDNDGIPDVLESPLCYVSKEAMASFARVGVIQVSSDLTRVTGNSELNNLVDGGGSYIVFTSSASIVDKTIMGFKFGNPLKIDTLKLETNTTTNFVNGTYKVQGSNDGTNWTDLTGDVAPIPAVYIDAYGYGSWNFKIPFTQNTGSYSYYRVRGVSGTISTGGNALYDAEFSISSYNQQYFTFPDCSKPDDDGDGFANELDLDSDNDGCFDSFESGSSGSNVSTVSGPYGANGFANSLESAPESGTINYSSTYIYAKSPSLVYCTDTDGDGVVDLLDLDDDNDGILDSRESQSEKIVSLKLGPSSGFSRSTTIGTTSQGWTMTYGNIDVYNPCNVNQDGGDGIDGGSLNFGLRRKIPTKPGRVYQFLYTSTRHALKNVSVGRVRALSGTNTQKILAENLRIHRTSDIECPFFETLSFVANSDSTVIEVASVSGIYGYPGDSTGYGSVYGTFRYREIGNYDDTDNDGIPNTLDLDSDGDGCYDKYEASVPGATKTGAVTDSLAATSSSQVGSNGLANSLETNDTQSANTNYLSDFAALALNNRLNACSDFDTDGIGDPADIDDDNDGTIDWVESSSCFLAVKDYQYSSLKKKYVYNISTQISMDNLIEDMVTPLTNGDLATKAFNFKYFVDVTNKELLRVDFNTAMDLSNIYVKYLANTYTMFNNAVIKIQGSVDGNTWTDLSPQLTYAYNTFQTNPYDSTTVGTQYNNDFPITLNKGKYMSYRLYGVSGTTHWGQVTELFFGFNSFNRSMYPVNDCIASVGDTDGDGKYNWMDLDSDGDGCSDAKEAGATTSNTPNYQFTGVVGTNGLVNGLETTADNGVINFSSTYTQYALNNALNVCADSDNDGIGDIIDIDDDNDGVLDTTEDCDASSVTNNQLNTLAKFTSAPTTISGDSQIGYSYTPTGISFNPGGSVGQHNGVALLGPFTSTGVSVTVSAIVRKDWGVSSYGGTVKGLFEILDNSQNVVGSLTWQDNSSNGSTDANNQTISFSGTVPTGNYYIRIKDNGSLSTSSGWGDDWAVKELTISTSKCNWDLDKDGIPNRLDLDSDGDGCSDAYESGATASVVPNYQFTGSVGANGFVNSLETAVDNGVINYSSTYSNAINNSIHTCPSCVAGTVAPALSSTTKVGVCPSTTVDLTSITASNLPAGTVLSWHTGSVASGSNKVATPSAVSGGTYYASFFDSANNCYSPTTLVTATAASCASGVIDCSKTQLYPAPVVGVSGQKVLYVTVNVSASGCFSPVSVSGSGFSVANGVTQICTATTGIQQLSVPVYYNGSSLGTMNFTIGASGSCGADLTSSPKKAVVDMWTIECLPTQGPVLK